MIKCPECGHQVSDKAPTCPSCGVEIAGKIVRCQQCGAVYFRENDECPICNYPNLRKREMSPTIPPPVPPASKPEKTAPEPKKAKKKSHWGILAFSFLMACVICGVFFYFYYTAKDTKETEAYNYAITSDDPLVLQSFLDTYRDADATRRDSIETRLQAIHQASKDWLDACTSKSKTTILKYLEKYPNSAHKGEALNKIDSIDWAKAKDLDTESGYEEYTKAHPNGAHVEDAEEGLKNLRMKHLQPEEVNIVQNLFRKFFQGANSNDEEMLKATLSEVMQSFQGKKNVSSYQVVEHMRQANASGKNWRVMGDYKIEKRPTETEQIEYDVKFTVVREDSQNPSNNNPSKYLVEAKVNSEGLIVEMNMTKIIT